MVKKYNNNKKSFFSIKAKVALLCTCSILIAVLVNSLFMGKVSKDAITSSTEITMQNMAESYNKNISDTVQQISQSANFMMSSSVISNFVNSGGKEDVTEVEELVSMFLNTNSSNENISLVDVNGIVLYSTDSSLIGKDLSGEDYFSEMVSSGLSAQGNVFTSESSGDACVTFAIPLRTDMIMGPIAERKDTLPIVETLPDQGSSSISEDTAPVTGSNVLPGSNEHEMAVTEFTGAIITNVKVSAFSSSLSEINIGDYETGYAFILDTDGSFVYHPDDSLIGTKVDNDELNSIISKVNSSKISDTKIVTYSFNGVSKYAGYSTNLDNSWTLFVAADRSEVFSALDKVVSQSLLISIILIAILTTFAYLFTGTITKSIQKITHLINKTAELDFTVDNSFANLSSQKDETGEMSRAIEKMRDVLKTMILHISEVSGKITESSENLSGISHSVNDHASDNSATAEELSASMEETAATTEQIYGAIEQIGNNSKDMIDKVTFGSKLSTDLIYSALDLKSTTERATDKTKKVYEEVKLRTDAALEQAKAVQKISVLTKTIKEIASQTNLLALNASIEAARAGEAGSGFSVVASEIGILANQSSKTVANITDIVNEVYKAVENMSKSLEQTLDFLENNVLVDYANFMNNSEKYNFDATTMNETMGGIHTQIDMLNTSVLGISESISEINLMVNEASEGVNDVAEKNTNIVALTNNTQVMAKENTEFANGLKSIVDKFKL
ncbi:MAG: methyl-accepting chemotaxis protein [Herbinix sp.]|jgi:methyl-accepting chemotaxis protein|nr:methyl-accepting chemotaxis protein [Herbinix sp.]